MDLALTRCGEEIVEFEAGVVPGQLACEAIRSGVGKKHACQVVKILEIRAACREGGFEVAKVERVRHRPVTCQMRAARACHERKPIRLGARDGGEWIPVDVECGVVAVEMPFALDP